MPFAPRQLEPSEAKRFAALLAGFDTGNGNDAEALAKARALREMVAKRKLRIVDVLEMPNVRRAIDDQMQPFRMESDELREALDALSAQREELTERTRNVRMLAELVREKEETEAELRKELAAVTLAAKRQAQYGAASRGPASSGARAHSFGAQSWFVEGAAVIVVAVLLVMAVFNGHFLERSKSNELGNNERSSASLVRKGGAVLPVPKSGAVHRRLRRGGSPARPRSIR